MWWVWASGSGRGPPPEGSLRALLLSQSLPLTPGQGWAGEGSGSRGAGRGGSAVAPGLLLCRAVPGLQWGSGPTGEARRRSSGRFPTSLLLIGAPHRAVTRGLTLACREASSLVLLALGVPVLGGSSSPGTWVPAVPPFCPPPLHGLPVPAHQAHQGPAFWSLPLALVWAGPAREAGKQMCP